MTFNFRITSNAPSNREHWSPDFTVGADIKCATDTGIAGVKVLDIQKRHHNYAYLVENEQGQLQWQLIVAWPKILRSAKNAIIAIFEEIKGRPLEVNPNISLMDRCFTSKYYIPF